MSKYKAVFFDLDGTLADTDLMIVMTMLKIFKEYKPDYKPTLKELIACSGPTLEESMRKHFPEENTTTLVNAFREISPKLYDQYVVLFPYVEEMLKTLKRLNLKLAVVTSKLREATILTLKHLNIHQYFDLLICVDDVAKPKPDPEGINKALKAMQLKAEEVLFIGDTNGDYMASKNAGMDCCLVSWAIRGIPDGAEPKYALDSYRNLERLIKDAN